MRRRMNHTKQEMIFMVDNICDETTSKAFRVVCEYGTDEEILKTYKALIEHGRRKHEKV